MPGLRQYYPQMTLNQKRQRNVIKSTLKQRIHKEITFIIWTDGFTPGVILHPFGASTNVINTSDANNVFYIKKS